MFTDRTHGRTRFFAALAAAVLISNGIGQVAFAQSAGQRRLSSNPHDLRDAFSQRPARSTKELVQHVKEDAALRQRYARHFGVPQEKIVSFFQNALVPYRIPQTETLTTFGVTKFGDIYPVKTTLPAGTRVWATRDGVPVVKWNCSNPLAYSLPDRHLVTPPLETVASTPVPALPFEESPSPVVPNTFATVGSPALPEDGSSLAVEPSTMPSFAFGVPGAVDTAGSSSLPGVGEIIDAGTSGGSSLWPLAVVPLALLLANSGSGSGGGSGETEPVLLPPDGAVVVPEGNSVALLAVGLPMLAGLAFLARRRRTAA